ncbi:hypothetical protein OSTOST_18089, partial [Ostertagia ostertagi]
MPLPSGEKKLNDLPANFCFTTDDPFYSGPATCNLLHYTPAAYMAGIVEMAMLASGSLWFWHCFNNKICYTRRTCRPASGCIPTFKRGNVPRNETEAGEKYIFYGLKTEQAKLLSPKLAFIQLEITILMMLAAVAIVAMSFGISLTHQLFSVFV